jgi:hypothetical protein
VKDSYKGMAVALTMNVKKSVVMDRKNIMGDEVENSIVSYLKSVLRFINSFNTKNLQHFERGSDTRFSTLGFSIDQPHLGP